MLKTRVVRLGGPEVHGHLGARAKDGAGGVLVRMLRDSSSAPMLNQRRRKKTVLDVIQCLRA